MIISDPVWATPPSALSLTRNIVHVWRAILDVSPTQVTMLRQLLSADEIERAGRFRFLRDQHRFIIGRGLLRMTLSRYLLRPPNALQFDYTPFGKPFLSSATNQGSLTFNVSHSDGLILYAVTCNRAIGVDIERIRSTIELEELALRFFSHTEYTYLCTLPVECRVMAFFRCWTCKEAYIKAIGAGLSLRLDRFAVSFMPNEQARLLYTLDDPQDVSRWSLQQLFPGSDYQAALAVAGHEWQLACWDWHEEDILHYARKDLYIEAI